MISTKLAASSEDSFEQTFFQLAYDALQDKLLNLLPFLVGFEVVKKDEDGTKAVGVFGFKSQGDQIIYVPAFFINGNIKGLDLLYSKNNEQFYPLSEDFAELFLKDTNTSLGKPTKLHRDQVAKDLPPADFRNLVAPPRTGKMSIASDVEYTQVFSPVTSFVNKCLSYIPDLDKLAGTNSLLDFVKKASPNTKYLFYGLMEKDADFTESVLRFYDLDKIAASLAVVPTPKAEQAKEISVIRKDQDSAKHKGLTENEKKDLQLKGYIIRDSRKKQDYSSFGEIEFQTKFQNPQETGFYPYVTKGGAIRYGLILVKPKQFQQGFVTDDDIVINLDDEGKGEAYLADTKDVFAKDQIKVSDYSKVHKMFVDPADGKPSYKDTYVLINEALKASQAFRIVANYKDATGVRRIEVEPYRAYKNCVDPKPYSPGEGERPGSAHDLPRGNFYEHPKRKDKMTLVFTKNTGDKFQCIGCNVFIPLGYKLLKINFGPVVDGSGSTPSPVEDADWKEEEQKRKERQVKYDREAPGHFSSIYGTFHSLNVFPLTVNTNGSDYFVKIDDTKKSYPNGVEAKIGMVVDFKMGVKEAESFINSLIPGITKKGFLKLAYTGDASPLPIEEVPYTNELGQLTYNGIGQENMLPTEQYMYRDPTQLGLGTTPNVEGIDPESVNTAVQLASAGQKQIFDTHTIATLSKYVAPSEKVTEYMPDFVKTLDSLGRLLFLTHWEMEKFKKMYGRSDMPKLVELLTNVFRNLGDLVIFLKRKSPDVSIDSVDSDTLDV
jgi:hypothetical protein